MLSNDDLTNQLTLYDGWNMSLPIIPGRSRLFPLEPIGLGTSNVESLTSYLTRLGEAHTVFVGDLIAQEIKTIIPKEYKSKDLFCTKHKSGTANSTGKVSQYLLSALSSLTKRNDLQFLTLTQWSEVLPQRNLIHPTKKWCPLCYQEQYQNNRIIYEPLIWFIKPVKICPIHRIKLISECPHCGELLLSLARNSQSGYCSNCKNWLETNQSDNSIVDSEWEFWVAKNIGELLAKTKGNAKRISRENIPKSLHRCLDQLDVDGITSFAKLVGFKKNQVWEWTNGKVIPTVSASLKISYSVGISLLEFLSEEKFQCLNLHGKNLPAIASKSRKNDSTIDFELAEEQLLTILSNPSQIPRSMSKVAKDLGFHRRTLTRRFPELTHQISTKYKQYKRDIRVQNIKECCREVEKVVAELNQKGIYPSESNVSQLISKPGNFRDQEVRNALRKARQRLGMKK